VWPLTRAIDLPNKVHLWSLSKLSGGDQRLTVGPTSVVVKPLNEQNQAVRPTPYGSQIAERIEGGGPIGLLWWSDRSSSIGWKSSWFDGQLVLIMIFHCVITISQLALVLIMIFNCVIIIFWLIRQLVLIMKFKYVLINTTISDLEGFNVTKTHCDFLQVTSHVIEHMSLCVHIRSLTPSLSPNVVLCNHKHEHSYLSWCAPA
jgi:hypothetical protein